MGELYFVVDDGGVYNVLSEEDLNTYGVEDDQIVGKPFTSFNVASKKADILNRQAEEASSDFSPAKGYFDESKQTKGALKITEAQLRGVVKEAVKSVLDEGILDDLWTAHKPSEEEISDPEVDDVIRENGWIIKGKTPTKKGVEYQIVQKTGAMGNTEGTLTLDELIEDLGVFGVEATIVKRERKYYDSPEAEKAIILLPKF